MNVRITDIDGKKPSFVQWDVDRVLYIEGTDSQPCLHFANPMLTRAIVVEAEADGSRWSCRVPNIILQTAAPIVISVFIQPDEGKTVLTDWVKVQPKLKPQDYTYEENIGYVNWVAKSAEAQAILDAIEDLRQEIAEAAEAADDAAEAAGEARDQAVAAADGIDESIATALQDAKDSGDFDGRDGDPGAPGAKGDPGNDGISPDVSVTAITGGHRITIVDADNTYVFDVMDGDPGDDGFSPDVSVATITGGHRVTITDAQGDHVFDVMDGEKGDKGDVGGVTYYTASVASTGALTMPSDMPTPTEIKSAVGDGADLPLLRVYDRGWTNGGDQDLNHRNIYYELRYAERPALAPIYAKFSNVLQVPSTGELVFVEVEGIEENGSTTWTIAKKSLPSGDNVLWATYNTTTEAEITAAVTAGKTVLCKISDEIFYLASKAAIGPSGSAWIFASANQSSMRVTWVSGSYWNSIGTRTIPNSASDIGAIAAPSSPATGAFLVWNGTAWVAQTLATWQAGSY